MDSLAMQIPPELLVLNRQFEEATFGSIILALAFVFVLSRAGARFIFYVHDKHVNRLAAPAFHEKQFWDAEYQKMKDPFEWYVQVDDLMPAISRHIPSSCRILYPGCGTSRLPEALSIARPNCQVVCCDVSELAITRMRELAQLSKGSNIMSFQVLDVLHTLKHFSPRSFNVVIDKGLLDSLLHDQVNGASNVHNCLDQYYDVLAEDGLFLLITTLDSHILQSFLEHSRFHCVSREPLAGSKPEWEGKRRNEMYVLRKHNTNNTQWS